MMEQEAEEKANPPPCMCLIPKPHRHKKWAKVLIDNLLIILIILAVVVALALGLGLRTVWSHEDLTKIWHLGFPGRLLLNMLNMLIIPLIMSSLVTAMTNIPSSVSGRLGAAAIVYYMSTTLIAVVIGIVLALSIQPGRSTSTKDLASTRTGGSPEVRALDSVLDLIAQCFPDNLVTACFERRITDFSGRKNFTGTENGINYTREVEVPSLKTSKGTNVLGIVAFSLVLGLVINSLKEKGKPLKDFFDSLNEASMMLVSVIIWYTPIGITFLIATKFVETEDLLEILSNLGLYTVTVLSGLFLHGFAVLPLIYFAMTRKSPIKFAGNMSKALFTAWGTASSSATLPITMDCLVRKNKVDINVVRFVAPVGATINLDGTALYEAVACLFIAQVNQLDLGVADIIIVSLTATAAAIGAAGIPQAGLVTMVIVLNAVGLPVEDITLIIAIDWFLDRFRTALNVFGDSVGAGILHHHFRNLLDKDDGIQADDAIDSKMAYSEVKDELLGYNSEVNNEDLVLANQGESTGSEKPSTALFRSQIRSSAVSATSTSVSQQ